MRLDRVFVIAVIPLLTACGPEISEGVCAALPVRTYPAEQMRQAATELDGLGPSAVVPRMMQDYREERAAIRAICGG